MSVQALSPTAFTSVLCGIDGSGADPETARQAAVLAGPGARLELLSVVDDTPGAITATPALTSTQARRALRTARAIAADHGAHPRDRIVQGEAEAEAVLAAASGHDLIAVGAPDEHRLAGILVGSVATNAVHAPRCPVLVCRPASAFPGTILLADDGYDDCAGAVSLAARIARQHGVDVVRAAPLLLGAPNRERLHRHAATVAEITGREPALLHVGEPPAKNLVSLAAELGCGLIVMGSRGKRGLRALGSVSERVAHHAPCSVLIVPA